MNEEWSFSMAERDGRDGHFRGAAVSPAKEGQILDGNPAFHLLDTMGKLICSPMHNLCWQQIILNWIVNAGR